MLCKASYAVASQDFVLLKSIAALQPACGSRMQPVKVCSVLMIECSEPMMPQSVRWQLSEGRHYPTCCQWSATT